MGFVVLGALSGCFLTRASLPPESEFPRDFALVVAIGEAGSARTEIHMLEGDPGDLKSRRLRIRQAENPTAWPPVFDSVFEGTLSARTLHRLSRALDASGFTTLAAVHDSLDHPDATPVVIRLRQNGRIQQVMARGRRLPPMVKAIEAIDAALPIEIDTWPRWLQPLERTKALRPPLVADANRALAFHRKWLAEDPQRKQLHIDIFALLCSLGRYDEARRELAVLGADPELAGFVPELSRLLR